MKTTPAPTQRNRVSLFNRGAMMAMFVLTIGASRAADLSGVYEDAGVTLGCSGPAVAEPSLRALLSLVSDAESASALREEISRVRIQHADGVLEISADDRADAVVWKGRWQERTNYLRDGAKVILRFGTGGAVGEDVFFIFEPVGSEGLMQVTLQRVTPSVLGPQVTERGVYVFHRAL